MIQVVLGLGSNMGDRFEYLIKAKNLINERIGDIIKTSSFYETEPWGVSEQSWFINQVLFCKTNKTAQEVLTNCMQIETLLGRTRSNVQYEERFIDIDILFYDKQIIKSKDLIIPHPQIVNRRFVLEPLCEIAPNFNHPEINEALRNLLKKCKDNLEVKKLD